MRRRTRHHNTGQFISGASLCELPRRQVINSIRVCDTVHRVCRGSLTSLPTASIICPIKKRCILILNIKFMSITFLYVKSCGRIRFETKRLIHLKCVSFSDFLLFSNWRLHIFLKASLFHKQVNLPTGECAIRSDTYFVLSIIIK